jgi:hypothetical protein
MQGKLAHMRHVQVTILYSGSGTTCLNFGVMPLAFNALVNEMCYINKLSEIGN